MKDVSTTISCVFLAVGIFAGEHANASLRATRVDCPSISVASLDRAVAFYTDVLDFQIVKREDTSPTARLAPGAPPATRARTAELSLGSECLAITEYITPKGHPFPVDSRANDYWFEHLAIVVSNMQQAYARVQAARVRFVSNAPQTLPAWNKQAAGIAAFYFRDSDGHYLELIHFPPGKGQAKWQAPSKQLFLGIDHTAIAVSDTRRSVEFYRDTLHFRVTGTSENYGVEQEHLSGVFNAHVLITSLRADAGIGIELLDYESPDSGRPIPADLHARDIACWQVPIEVANGSSHEDAKVLHGAHWSRLPSGSSSHEAAWIKDPDGHLLELIKE
jgi:catechol 2,3-dioxygenase-like lactoylglutathione lyase family enzyme